jgi:predicted metal-dependent HD superfamily phosphohydrolase
MECLTHLREYRELAQRPAEIEIALWFHDAVYDTSRTDNEERSAQWAERYLSSERAERAIVSRIATMIRATEKHDPRGADAELLVDIDLGILGAATTAFEAYDQGLRREYEWVPEDAYRETRHAFLHELLARETIYRTDTFRRKYEARARRNLSGKVRELEAAV